jgi:beta-glucanase (GH16 family)
MTQENKASIHKNKEKFFEDFTSDRINRDHWNVMVTGEVFNCEQQAYVDSTETVYLDSSFDEDANGVLVLHPRFKPNFITQDGKRFDFISGRIDTKGKVEFTQGKLSARIKMSSGAGLWPALWLLGKGSWPGCGEIDIMEYVGEPDWISSAVHGNGFSGDSALVNNYYFPAYHGVTNWHVYSLNLRQDRSMEFYVDDKLVYRVTKPMVEYFSPWIFDQPKGIVLNFAIGGGYPYKINGLKKPYYGLSEESVKAIQKNEVRYLIDWVRISQS